MPGDPVGQARQGLVSVHPEHQLHVARPKRGGAGVPHEPYVIGEVVVAPLPQRQGVVNYGPQAGHLVCRHGEPEEAVS